MCSGLSLLSFFRILVALCRQCLGIRIFLQRCQYLKCPLYKFRFIFYFSSFTRNIIIFYFLESLSSISILFLSPSFSLSSSFNHYILSNFSSTLENLSNLPLIASNFIVISSISAGARRCFSSQPFREKSPKCRIRSIFCRVYFCFINLI